MPLIRCSDQKGKSLEEFYTELLPDNITTFADVSTPMFHVIKLLDETFSETIIYGLTSLATLKLLARDTYLSPWYVTLKGLGDEYYIEYLMSPNKQPWPDATITGVTRSLDELKEFIIIAMTECEGWQDSNELKKLYKEIKSSVR